MFDFKEFVSAGTILYIIFYGNSSQGGFIESIWTNREIAYKRLFEVKKNQQLYFWIEEHRINDIADKKPKLENNKIDTI